MDEFEWRNGGGSYIDYTSDYSVGNEDYQAVKPFTYVPQLPRAEKFTQPVVYACTEVVNKIPDKMFIWMIIILLVVTIAIMLQRICFLEKMVFHSMNHRVVVTTNATVPESSDESE